MDASERGQLTNEAATIYEEFFVPALFTEWPDRLLDAARVEPRARVLDVACGTGVLARRAAERAGADGHVVGLDVNDGMLAAARASDPSVEWVRGVAEKLPFDPDSFDAVVSQFGLMFFDDQVAAIAEMGRVARPGAPVVVAVWAPLEITPGYAKMAELLHRLFGPAVATALHAPYSLGDEKLLASLFASAGLDVPEIATHVGTARFDSIESWVHTDIRGWTLADVIDDDQYATLLAHARSELQAFAGDDGQVRFDAPAHIAVSQGV